MNKIIPLLVIATLVLVNIGAVGHSNPYLRDMTQDEKTEYPSGKLDTIFIPEEDVVSSNGPHNDIGYNVDGGKNPSRAYNVYVGEPVDQTIPGRGRTGDLDPTGGDDEDCYCFSVCAGQFIEASLTSDEDYNFTLCDTEGNPVSSSYTADVTGWYYLHIFADDDPDLGEYTFTLTLNGQNDTGIGDDAGDTITEATPIEPGTYIGYMDCNDQEDWYSCAVNSGEGIFITVDAMEKTDYDVYLYNPSGELVHAAQYYGEDTLEYSADTSGTWTFKLDMFPGWDESKWPDNYFLYGSGVYELELSIGGTAQDPPDPIPQPEIIPVAQTFIVNDDPESNNDEYGYLAAVPAANYMTGETRYVSPIIYQGVSEVTNWFGTVDDTTQYLIDDWNTYLGRHGMTATEYTVQSDPVTAAATIATEHWTSSDLAVIAVDGSDYEDTVRIVLDRNAQLNAQTEVKSIPPDSDELKEIGGLYMVPLLIGPKWGAIAVHGLGSNFAGDVGITTARYESLMSDWWPFSSPPYPSGPDVDVYHPITLPGLWLPYTNTLSGLEEIQITKVAGNRYKIPVRTTDCSLKVTVTTDEPSALRVYLIDPYGNVRRPKVPSWNGGPINPIHIWNGGHWEEIGYEGWHFWQPELSTEHSVEVHHPMKGRWTAIVVPASVDTADETFNYHITGEIRRHSPQRVAAALSAANGAVIASQEHAPLLFVTEDSVPSETSDALSQLGVQNIIFINIDEISSANPSGTVTEYTTMQEVIDALGENPDNLITITSLATGDGYFAPAAMIAAYHGSPILNIGETAEAYDVLDKLVTWEEYAGDYYHGCRSIGHLPVMNRTFDFKEFIEGIKNGIFPHPGFDLKLRWYSKIYEGVHDLIDGYGLDKPGKEAYLFVSPRDKDIRGNICRAMNGNNSYAGQIPVEPTAFSSALVCRDILYPALIFVNPGRNVTSSCIMNHWEGHTWKTNDEERHTSVVTKDLKKSFFSHGRFYEGHTLWENLLARYNAGASMIYHCSHGTGGSGICCMYENVAEQFPPAELRHEHLKDFDWWDGWRGYYYDNTKTETPRTDGRFWINPDEPNLYDFVHFKWCDELFDNLHSQFNMWQSCTTASHFGPMIYLEHGAALYYGNANTGRSPQSDMLDYWMFQEFLQNGLSIGEAHSKYLWLHDRDFTTCDPTTLYGKSSLNLGDQYGDGDGLANEWVIFGDPTMICYSPEWVEPVPVDV
jgi:hypothetical protein